MIDALTSAVGSNGTICMPTLSYGYYTPRRPPDLFDPRSTPSVVGRIPEVFRAREGVSRSVHPTHSVAAVGTQAAALLRDHYLSDTPCGVHSPWGRIAAAGGSVILLGVGTKVCTMFHGPEEVVEPELRCTLPIACRVIDDGTERVVHLRLHKPYRGAVSDRVAMAGVLEAEGAISRATVRDTVLTKIDASVLWEVSTRLLQARPSMGRDRLSAWVRFAGGKALRR